MGRPCLVGEEKMEACIYKAPKSLREKIELQVKRLQNAGWKDATFSSVQRAIIENNIDKAEANYCVYKHRSQVQSK